MCGIAGLVGPPLPTASPRHSIRERLERMSAALTHRGPDDAGILSDPSGGLALRRLAIVGIGNGRQPILSENGEYAIVGNGEIYNAPELRPQLEARGHRFLTDSDIETVLHLFEDEGTDSFRHLNGMFALAIREQATGRILICRDRLGIKPLYYASSSNGTFFASEILALRRGLLAEDADLLAMDPVSLRDYLTLGYVPAPRTLYRGIQQLPAGHWAWLTVRGVDVTPWWQLPPLRA